MTILVFQFASITLYYFHYNARIKIDLKLFNYDTNLKFVTFLSEEGCRFMFARFYCNCEWKYNNKKFWIIFNKTIKHINEIPNDEFLRASIKLNLTDQFYNSSHLYNHFDQGKSPKVNNYIHQGYEYKSIK